MIMNDAKIRWVSTSCEKPWEEMKEVKEAEGSVNLELSGSRHQTVDGFGGCFNELGWEAMSCLSQGERESILNQLFNPVDGLKFNFCRLPVGASDYAMEWYSHNEVEGDYGMEHFSIKRDYQYLIPYIKESLKYRPDMKFFASPWSPPTWMKFPKAYNYGTLIWKKEILEAYALYFVKFVKAYEAEGIKINQIHVQNEVVADQKFPSCLWTGERLRDFIRDYMGPAFEKNGMDTEIWLGTINAPDNAMPDRDNEHDVSADTVLIDDEARKYIKGVGYQWAGKHAIQRTHESWPEMKLMQTENECGDGKNTWDYAHYIFTLFRHYFANGANAYIYWNMVLQAEGRSTWGWKQNSLVSVNTETKEITYNPEFYLMKHFSHFVSPGAVRLGLKGHWTGNALAFENPNGELIVIAANPFNEDRKLTLNTGKDIFTANLKARSFNTLLIK